MPDTCWAEPFIENPGEARFVFDPENYYWKYTLRLVNKQLQLGRGKYFVEFPDLIEGLDTLAAMRGTKNLHIDMRRRPDWVHSSLRQITDRYFHYYDILYDMIRDEVGGSIYWVWAPGRMAKFQCDFSAMISPDMFEEFVVPVLREMSERASYNMYHWDGPGALPHHELLMSIPGLDILQWTPGWGVEQGGHERWWPIYHSTFEGGKRIYIGCSEIAELRALKEEFGEDFKKFMLSTNAKSLRQAEEILELVND